MGAGSPANMRRDLRSREVTLGLAYRVRIRGRGRGKARVRLRVIEVTKSRDTSR